MPNTTHNFIVLLKINKASNYLPAMFYAKGLIHTLYAGKSGFVQLAKRILFFFRKKCIINV